jgi:hypothetical protein
VVSVFTEIDRRIANARRRLTLANKREASATYPEALHRAQRVVAECERELNRALAVRAHVARLAERDPVALQMSAEIAAAMEGE